MSAERPNPGRTETCAVAAIPFLLKVISIELRCFRPDEAFPGSRAKRRRPLPSSDGCCSSVMILRLFLFCSASSAVIQ